MAGAVLARGTEMNIIEGRFALVSGGNCTTQWMIDGEDFEQRAKVQWDAENAAYYGDFSPGMIYERGVAGFCLVDENGMIREVMTTREAAERCVARNA